MSTPDFVSIPDFGGKPKSGSLAVDKTWASPACPGLHVIAPAEVHDE